MKWETQINILKHKNSAQNSEERDSKEPSEEILIE